ncbi:MAG: fumarylacetoacetate hydrolase family protein [Caldimonas sp.]
MKFITFISGDTTRLGLLDGTGVIDVQRADPSVPADLRAALRRGVDLHRVGTGLLASKVERIALDTLRLAPAVPNPGKIICLGLNYYDHAKEGGREKPEYPWFFFRGESSLIAHGDAGLRPRVSTMFDYEAELAVVIGTRVPRHVTAEAALAHVFAFSCFNDMSVRDYQKRTPQWTIGKNFDGSGAFGPCLVTADELPPGASGLRIEGRLNGTVMQQASTSDMIWGVAETIALLSQALTLEPADVIVTGTPAGVGQARKPPVWMKAGDVYEVEIEGVGTLRNPIRDEI